MTERASVAEELAERLEKWTSRTKFVPYSGKVVVDFTDAERDLIVAALRFTAAYHGDRIEALLYERDRLDAALARCEKERGSK